MVGKVHAPEDQLNETSQLAPNASQLTGCYQKRYALNNPPGRSEPWSLSLGQSAQNAVRGKARLVDVTELPHPFNLLGAVRN
jgi:hypothetical protein